MVRGNSLYKTTNPALHRLKRFLSKFSQYLLLIFLFILLASHENTNPRLGESFVDFYLTESKHLIEINTKAYLINVPVDQGTIQQRLQLLTNEFYAQNNYSPVWTINFTGTDQLNSLIHLIDSAEYFGFPRSFLNSNRLSMMLEKLEVNTFEEEKLGQRIDLEIEATHTAFLYMIYMRNGIISFDTSTSFVAFTERLPLILNNSIKLNIVEEEILALQPNNKIYKNIIRALPQYIITLQNISKASDGLSISLLAEVLHYTGILPKRHFDSVMTPEKAIAEYQQEHNLTANGILNTTTFEKISEEIKQKYNLIALNLDRLRKVSVNSNNYLFVNIPEYQLHVFRNNLEEASYKVIVGATKTPTPVLSSRLERIITNPYWTVPKSITNNEMLSKIRNDSTYLQRNGYFIINGREEKVEASNMEWGLDDPLGKKYWIRQNYGSGNALGKIKFIFQNDHRVYLHDTPGKHLFNKETRAFSHGCIRVQNPEQLAQYISDNYYTPKNETISIKSSIAKRKREIFTIDEIIEVHIQYITCTANTDNELVFYNDLYKLDQVEIEKLFSQKITI
jgi:L,D-transpeptidase YcbB